MTAASLRKVLGSYYTPHQLVAHALELLPEPPARARIVDLACGDGRWLAGAAARWPDSCLSGIDLDPRAIEAATRLGLDAELRVGDGLSAPLESAELVVGNPPWGAGRGPKSRRGSESASAFVARAVALLPTGGRLCLVLPAAWLEVAAHRSARRELLESCALERVEPLGHVFPGVFAPAALVIARREPDLAMRLGAQVWTPRGEVHQSLFWDDPDYALQCPLSLHDRQILAAMESRAETLRGRVTFVLGVVTGRNRTALSSLPSDGEPILRGRDIAPFHISSPSCWLKLPLERVQQAAPRAAYAREKLVYRFISARPVVAVDRQGQLTLNSANAIALDDPALDLDFLAAVLNSTPLAFAHAARCRTPRLLRRHFERLPLPRASAAERRQIAGLGQSKSAIRELDERVMDLFALDDLARAQVRRSCPRS